MNNNVYKGLTVEELEKILVDLFYGKHKDKQLMYEASLVKCDLCTHQWVAVRPAGLTILECPNCDNMVTFENINTDDRERDKRNL